MMATVMPRRRRVRTNVAAPGVSRTRSLARSSAGPSSPSRRATRWCSAVSKSSSPAIAAAVISATCSPVPASSASRSMISSWIRVWSTSSTTSRLLRVPTTSRSTARSKPCSFAVATAASRSSPSDASTTANWYAVTGVRDSRRIRSMLPPAFAMAAVTAARSPGVRVSASTVTVCTRRNGVGVGSTGSKCTCMPRSQPNSRRSRSRSRPAGTRIKIPRFRRPRMTTCSMSPTSAPASWSMPSSSVVSPGPSGPVTETRMVSWSVTTFARSTDAVEHVA